MKKSQLLKLKFIKIYAFLLITTKYASDKITLLKYGCESDKSMKKRIVAFQVFLFLVINQSFLFAQNEASSNSVKEKISEIVSTESSVLLFSENNNGSLFAISSGDSVKLYDSSDYSPVCEFYDQQVSKMSFYTEDGNEFFADLTKDGQFTVRKLTHEENSWSYTQDEPYFSADCADPTGKRKLTTVAFSSNSDYIAAAFDDNSVQVHFRLRVTAGSISHTITKHKAPVYGLEFSRNGEYLATVSTDGEAYIWNSYTSNQITRLKGIYTRSNVPVVFSADSVYIVFQDGRNTFKIADFSGNTLYSIAAGRPITGIKPLKDPDLISIRNDKGEVMVYSISSRRPISVSSASKLMAEVGETYVDANFTSYDFDTAVSHMYAGFKNGKVYLIEPTPYLDDTAMLITDASKAGKGLGNFVHQRFSSVTISGGTNYMTKPYLMSANLRGEYLYSGKISPFFVGGGLSLGAGFPRKDFPANYKVHDEYVSSPKLLFTSIYIPAGYAFSPWNNEVRIITTFKAGVKMQSLALITKEGSIIGDPAFSFYMSAGAGMQIKWFQFDLNCEYDAIGKVSPSLYAGYAFRWGE